MNRNLGIFIFHNDLRISDNLGLAQISKMCDVVLPVFIFTPEQISSSNKYRSMPAIEFMLAQLAILDAELHHNSGRLYMFYGSTTRVMTKLIQAMKPIVVCNNANYTPFALDRDSTLKAACERLGCEYVLCEDYGMYGIGAVTRNEADPIKGVYKKFTPYYNAAKRTPPSKPLRYQLGKLYNGTIKGAVQLTDVRRKLNVKAINIESATQMLNSIHKQTSYNRDRDKLAIATTRLSAHMKFGAVSPREVYWKVRSLGTKSSDLVKQLYWREFYMNIAWAYPYVFQQRNFNTNFHANWKSSGDMTELIAWCKGKTGFPIVDACMRELNITGYMHNRGRLIVAGFLTKLLGWHWKYGEMYFATRLRDYDPAQNNGNWQFVAGSGVDQQPYFRMFNPWLQSKDHDPDCVYIKHWCPEYAGFPNNVLHNEAKLREYISDNGLQNKITSPIVAYEQQRDSTKRRYLKHA